MKLNVMSGDAWIERIFRDNISDFDNLQGKVNYWGYKSYIDFDLDSYDGYHKFLQRFGVTGLIDMGDSLLAYVKVRADLDTHTVCLQIDENDTFLKTYARNYDIG